MLFGLKYLLNLCYLWAKTYFYDFKIIPENMRPESIPNFRAEKYSAEFW